jgi:hypothetical protein
MQGDPMLTMADVGSHRGGLVSEGGRAPIDIRNSKLYSGYNNPPIHLLARKFNGPGATSIRGGELGICEVEG